MGKDKYRQLLESTLAIPWELDPGPWRFTYVGPQAETISGFPVEDWYGENFWIEHIHPDDQQQTLSFCQQHVERGEDHDFEYRMITSHGQTIWVHNNVSIVRENGKPVRLHGFMFDITKQKHTTEQLHLQASIVEQVHDSVVATDLEGNITLWNKGAELLFGYTAEEVMGKPIITLYPEHEHEFLNEKIIAPLLEKGKHEIVSRKYKKNGQMFYGHLSMSLLHDHAGQPAGMIGYTIDVTDRIRSEEAIKNIAAGVSSKIGTKFFNQLVTHLAKLFDADYAYIGLLDADDHELMHSLAICAHGEIADSMSYSLIDTPCANVVGLHTCIYPNDIQNRFPKDILLQKMGVESYIGTPLFDVEGKPLGIISVLDSNPMAASQAQVDILEIFAARASAELERSRAEQRLEDTKQRLSLHIQHTPLGVIELNTKLEVVEWNPSAERIFGHSHNEATGRSIKQLIIPENVLEHTETVWQDLLAQKGGRRSSNENITKYGRTITCEWYNTTLVGNNGEVIGIASLVDDITDRTKAEEEIQHLAYHDALTGLVNRSEFEQRLQQLLLNTQDKNSVHALLYLDLDQFKVINDTCGHAAGDAMLKALTGLLQEKVRDTDTLARLGGDEFGILLLGCPLLQAQHIAEEIISVTRGYHFDWKGASFEVGVSIGIAPIDHESHDFARILSAADVACYMAKDMGRGRVRVYNSDDHELAQRHGEMEWVSRINLAMDEDRFLLYEQDIIALNGNANSNKHKELLLRLRDAEGQLIRPDIFIPPAERFNLMPTLDRWVIQQSFAKIAQTHDIDDIYAINISGTSLNDNDLVEYIDKQFKDTDLSPERICFEITETAAISNLARAEVLIQQLKEMGCMFSLDDFGKGASSFTYLKNLSVDFLKIDGGFISGSIRDPADYAIIESINNIGHALGIKTIAECVENENSLHKLKEIGVDYAQGYIISRPVPFSH